MTKSKAIKLFKTQKLLAKALKIDQSAVSKWKDDKIPPLREYQIKEILAKRKKRAKK